MVSSNAARQKKDGASGDGLVPSERVCEVASRAWYRINFVPARASAVAFAIVGNFEEAVANWRTLNASGLDKNDDIVIAAAAGALNLSLVPQVDADTSGSSRQPELAHLASMVGLVWRSVVLWMLFLALLTLANSVG
jgi:adenosylcobinamide-phosphate synthase